MTPAAQDSRKPRASRLVAAFWTSLVIQLVMIAIGVWFLLVRDTLTSLLTLTAWCVLGSVYAGTALLVLGRMSSAPQTDEEPLRLEISFGARVLSYAETFVASLIGVAAAFTVLAFDTDPQYGVVIDIVGVWAMLLSWGFLHWGFTQIYLQLYYRADAAPMRFPSTPNPSIVDFAYFSFTIGTSFAASDVEVLTSRVRWRVIWQSVLSFFFNGLIVVLALNTIQTFARHV